MVYANGAFVDAENCISHRLASVRSFPRLAARGEYFAVRAAERFGPFVVLLGQDGAGAADDGIAAGKGGGGPPLFSRSGVIAWPGAPGGNAATRRQFLASRASGVPLRGKAPVL